MPEAGSFSVAGKRITPGRPDKSSAAGIGMVHQHPTGSSSLTVLENIILGYEPLRAAFLIDRVKARKTIETIQAEYDLPLELDLTASRLNSAQIQRMELIHLLYKEKGILIFDEPTASLSDNQIDHFLKTLGKLKERGKTILFITHKLGEIFRMADSIAVLRKGKLVLHEEIKGQTPESVASHMIGGKEELEYPVRRAHNNLEKRDVLFELRGIGIKGMGNQFLRELDLTVHRGEILGVTGIRENGLELLEDVISGMLHPTKGAMFFNGHDVTRSAPAELRKAGISYVPADRMTRGVSRNSTIAENLILLNYKNMHKMGFLTPAAVNRWAKDMQNNYCIDGEPHQPVSHLSGGNIQKVILSRELHEDPEMIIICEPSWGLDFNSRNRLHRKLDQTASEGTSVLLISSDIDEILAISDRVAVLYDGRFNTVKNKEELDRITAGEYMLGLRSDS